MQRFRGGKWKYDHFPDMKSRARQDSIMIFSRIGWTSFPFLPWTVFSREWGGGGKKWKETVMIGIVMDANINWIAFFSSLSLLERLLHRKTHYTFTSSKGHSNFYHTHFRVEEPGKKRENKTKATFKNNKMGLMQFQESKWVGGLRCYRALVWSQLLLSLFLSLPWPSLFLSHFLFPLLWLWAYELALALPHYTPSGALKRQGRRS